MTKMEIDENAVVLELARREEARRQDWRESIQKNLWSYLQYKAPGWYLDEKWYLKELAGILQKVTNREILYLIIDMPPQIGKSRLVSDWIEWDLGNHPTGCFMRTSHTFTLAETFSMNIREFVKTPEYRKVFPGLFLSSHKKALEAWSLKTAKVYSYFCAGVGGSITGKGCDRAGIVDDPVKDWEDALSKTMMDNKWDWYTSVFRSRLQPDIDVPEIVISTRWTRHDITGHLIRVEGVVERGGKWLVYEYPALDKNDKTISPYYMSTEKLLSKRRDYEKGEQRWIWEALYQQNPIEKKGLLFPERKLQRFHLADIKYLNEDYRVGVCDTADTGADSLCSVIGLVQGLKVYIIDFIHNPQEMEITEALVSNQIIEWHPPRFGIESNAGGRGFARNIRKLIENKAATKIVDYDTTSNKETRIIMGSSQIIKHFYFLVEEEQNDHYRRAFRELTDYVMKKARQDDNTPDVLTRLTELVYRSNQLKVSILK